MKTIPYLLSSKEIINGYISTVQFFTIRIKTYSYNDLTEINVKLLLKTKALTLFLINLPCHQ